MVINCKAVRWFGAAAIAFWPFVLIHPGLTEGQRIDVLRHEAVHLRQQRPWCIAALYLGSPVVWFVWYFLYLCVLPAGWNPFRWKWELDAFREQGLEDERIVEILKRPPYYLTWMGK